MWMYSKYRYVFLKPLYLITSSCVCLAMSRGKPDPRHAPYYNPRFPSSTSHYQSQQHGAGQSDPRQGPYYNPRPHSSTSHYQPSQHRAGQPAGARTDDQQQELRRCIDGRDERRYRDAICDYCSDKNYSVRHTHMSSEGVRVFAMEQCSPASCASRGSP